MRCIGMCMIIMACMMIVFAQVEEIPAMRSQEAVPPRTGAKSVLDSTTQPGSPASTGREALTEEENDQMRSFLTVNSMIIIIVILIVILAFFLIINKIRRSRQP